jgi:hypothetical protein
MPPARTALVAALGVLLLVALLVAALVVTRGSRGIDPTSAATAGPQATLAPTRAPTPAAAQTGATARPPTPAATPSGQTILTFTVPATFKCDAAGQANQYVHLAWTTAHATGVSISIDGPGRYADYAASGSADVPFACGEPQHTYLLTTHGSGQPATRTIVIKRAA